MIYRFMSLMDNVVIRWTWQHGFQISPPIEDDKVVVEYVRLDPKDLEKTYEAYVKACIAHKDRTGLPFRMHF